MIMKKKTEIRLVCINNATKESEKIYQAKEVEIIKKEVL